MKQTRLVAMLRLSRFLWTSSAEASRPASRVLATVASRLPAEGLTLPHLQALLEHEFPHFTPASVGATSLFDAFQTRPELFVVSGTTPADWVVRPLGPNTAQPSLSTSGTPPDKPVSSHTPGAARTTEVYQRLCDYLRAQSPNTQNGHSFSSLEVALRAIGCEEDAEAVLDHLATQASSQEVETDLSLHVKLVRQPRAAIVFVDGSELPATAVNDMCDELCLIKERSTVFIARHAHHTPLSPVDAVSPHTVPLYLSIEKKARQLARRNPLVLQDVVYMCSARQFNTYARHVAKMNEFPDADVYVCCPSRLHLVQPKTLVPLSDSADCECAEVRPAGWSSVSSS